MATAASSKKIAVTVRNLPANVHVALKRQAKAHGISTEAEIRSILQNAVQPTKRLTPADLLVAYGKKWGTLPFVKNNEPVRAVKFE